MIKGNLAASRAELKHIDSKIEDLKTLEKNSKNCSPETKKYISAHIERLTGEKKSVEDQIGAVEAQQLSIQQELREIPAARA
jgi:hypothetical protein